MAADELQGGEWELDLRKDRVRLSKDFLDLYQLKNSDIDQPGLEWLASLAHPEHRERVNRAIERTMNGQAETFEAQFRSACSKGRSIVRRGFVESAWQGRPAYIVGIDMVRDLARVRQSL